MSDAVARPYVLNPDFFFLDQVDHAEICRVLRGHFTHGEYSNERRQILSDSAKSKWLIIDFDKDHQIIAIAPAGLTSQELEAIQQDLKQKLIDTQKEAIGQMVLLSTGQIEGRFRYKQEFQIAPAPNDIPRMDHIFGEHPYLLQLRYQCCGDQLTNDLRFRKRAFEIVSLLNGLLRTRFLLPTKYTVFSWGRLLDNSNDPEPKRFQEGYAIKKLDITDTAFDDQSPLIELMPSHKYYDVHNNVSWPVVLPDQFEILLDNTFSLPKQDFQKLGRACRWLTVGHRIWRISESASFLCVVSALESLIGRPERCPECNQSITQGLSTCSSCGQPQYKITKKFKDFIQKYAPRAASNERFMKVLYPLRSGLAHGLGDLLQSDMTPWASFEKPEQAYQELLHQNLFDCASEAIVNWVGREKTSPNQKTK